jgi:hypothetical protein
LMRTGASTPHKTMRKFSFNIFRHKEIITNFNF